MNASRNHKVLIIGAGFGGLFAAHTLASRNVDVTLIDRNNFHTFTPLLYQVATCALDPGQIAYPVRTIFRGADNIHALLGTVTAIDTDAQLISVAVGERTYTEDYDYLILAPGSVPAYFGNEAFQQYAFDLRTLQDAVDLRNHILACFEEAAWEQDTAKRAALLTIVVAGGGPTGLETAGAIYELYNHVLDKEYTFRDLRARVLLVEQQDHLLASYPGALQKAALHQMKTLGVEVHLGSPVTAAEEGLVRLADGSEIGTHTFIWSAGVNASPLVRLLDAERGPNERIRITPNIHIDGSERVFVVGDAAYLEDQVGRPLPMLIPVAQQQGIHAARNILRAINGEAMQPFQYHDRGMMATIGRSRAVAWLYNRIQLRGMAAWLVWLVFHLMTLLGFSNRLNVFTHWVWNYFTYDRSVRLILARSQGMD